MTASNVILQGWINREDLQNNAGKAFYLFGDNTVRKGMGGQAGAMRGEPNAIGVATKLTPTSGSNAYFSDLEFEHNVAIIASDLQRAFDVRDNGFIVVIPTDGLGTGLSELPTRAPRTNAVLDELLDMLENGETPEWSKYKQS